MRVKDIAEQAGVSAELVRYYLRIGLLSSVGIDKSGYRRFTNRELHRLKFIIRAKHLGFTLAEIAQIIAMAGRGETPCPVVREVVKNRVRDNKIDLNALRVLQTRMEEALVKWDGMADGVPTGDAICVLIESTSL